MTANCNYGNEVSGRIKRGEFLE